jgi:uncharacterized protein (DUF2252 family)
MRSAVDQLLAYNRNFDRTSLARKLARMSESAFAFFRGTFHVFAFDILEGPFHEWPAMAAHGAMIGDLHTENFGTFRAVSGDIVYDINDFDETTTSLYDYDLRRLTTSIALAAFDNAQTLTQVTAAVERCARGYLETLVQLAPVKTRADFEKLKEAKEVHAVLSDAKEQSRPDMMRKLAVQGVDGHFAFKPADSFTPVNAEVRAAVMAALPHFLKSLAPRHDATKYTFQDVVFRYAGCGSLGRQRYALLLGKGETDKETYDTLRLVEWKDSLDSGLCAKEPHASPGRAKQVIDNTVGFQINPRRYLGYVTVEGRPMQSREIGANDTRFSHKLFRDPDKFARAAQIFGEITARAHLVSSLGSDGPRTLAHEIKGLQDRWVNRMAAFALAYAHQAKDDYDEFIARKAEVAKAWGVKSLTAG